MNAAMMHNETISPWVQRFAPLIPGGEVLDLACGTGRHARHLAALGHLVLAVDRNADALAEAAGDGIVTSEIDLEVADCPWPFGPQRFAGIVVTNYLHRPLVPGMVDSLLPNGMLIYETFSQGNEQFGKPTNPDFLLAPGELLAWALRHELRVIAFEDGVVDAPKTAMVQRICVVKPDFPRVAALLPPF